MSLVGTKWQRFVTKGVAVIVVIVALVTAGMWWMRPFAFGRNQAWYEGVVKQVVSGALTPDANGVIKLNGSSIRGPAGSPVDEVYVSGSTTTGWLIYFPHWHGKGMNVEGYLFAQPAPTGKSVHLNTRWGGLGPPGSTINAQYDPHATPRQPAREHPGPLK